MRRGRGKRGKSHAKNFEDDAADAEGNLWLLVGLGKVEAMGRVQKRGGEVGLYKGAGAHKRRAGDSVPGELRSDLRIARLK